MSDTMFEFLDKFFNYYLEGTARLIGTGPYGPPYGPARIGDWWTFLITWGIIESAIVVIAIAFIIKLIIIWIIWSWFFYGFTEPTASDRSLLYRQTRKAITGRSPNDENDPYYLENILKIINSIETVL